MDSDEKENGNLKMKIAAGAPAMSPYLWSFLKAGRIVNCMGQYWNFSFGWHVNFIKVCASYVLFTCIVQATITIMNSYPRFHAVPIRFAHILQINYQSGSIYIREGFKKKRPFFIVFDYEGGGSAEK